MALSDVSEDFPFTEVKRSISPLEAIKSVFRIFSWRYGLFGPPAAVAAAVAAGWDRWMEGVPRVYRGIQGYTVVYTAPSGIIFIRQHRPSSASSVIGQNRPSSASSVIRRPSIVRHPSSVPFPCALDSVFSIQYSVSSFQKQLKHAFLLFCFSAV